MTLDLRSMDRLQGVNEGLARVVVRASDEVATMFPGLVFVVTEGLRTLERQKQLFAQGASRTMQSRHLTGDAVDLAAKVGDEVRWELNLYYRLALAMRAASIAEGVKVRWGGCWRVLDTIDATEDAFGAAVAGYGMQARRLGQRPLVDGPHFEIPA